MLRLDYVLVGGGLQNALNALALMTCRPGARVALVERGPTLGGNHTWCFHGADVPLEAVPFVEPLVARRWERYRVNFPELSRVVDEPYAAVTAERLASVVGERARRSSVELITGEAAAEVAPGRVELASGRTLECAVVVDARGPEHFGSDAVGFQKFVGLELEVPHGTGPREPLLMDACVEQTDGFRFFYVLPLADDRVLVEDTYFSDTADLDRPRLRREIAEYAARAGWAGDRVLREERGVLPLPARAPQAAEPRAGVVEAGYHGGFFHPTTGYSFPLAVRFALTLAQSGPAELPERVRALAASEGRQQRFASLLNRLLFRGFAPRDRYHLLERFYRLPDSTIRRFYALTLTRTDRARILCGRPPRGWSLGGLRSAFAAEPGLALRGGQA